MENLPPKYVSPPGTWRTKAGLRAASLAWNIVLLGLVISLATTARVNTYLPLLVVLPAVVAASIWDIAELICIFKRGGNRGIHPGAIVAVDLILWLGWGLVALFLGASGITRRARYLIEDYSGYDGYRYRYDSTKVTDEDKKLEERVMGMGRAMVAFVTLAL